MARNYKQGKFTPKNRGKYTGSYPIYYRSSWELVLMQYCDKKSSIVEWKSESNIIPYISPVDKRAHRYFVDFLIRQQKPDGSIETFLVEVKPKKETQKPKLQGKKKLRQLQEAQTYLVNQAKWAAARKWCDKRGYRFVIMTEKELGIEKKKYK